MSNSAETRLRADFSKRVVVATRDEPWVPSPQHGVDRCMLDRIGGEVARATSLVRYAAASRFPPHQHEAGEEFLVLDGVFSDEHGDYPAGTYVRNPPGSAHATHTEGGCTIFVKLRQMHPDERRRVVITTNDAPWSSNSVGRSSLQLFVSPDGTENVAIERLAPNATIAQYVCHGGEEILVLSGVLSDEFGDHGPGVWLRNPDGFRNALASRDGCTYWVKRGHLAPHSLP
jgi:anti-sigma factor ChrR (cupin superfamily)